MVLFRTTDAISLAFLLVTAPLSLCCLSQESQIIASGPESICGTQFDQKNGDGRLAILSVDQVSENTYVVAQLLFSLSY